MFKSHSHNIMLATLKICLVLGVLLLPVAASVTSDYALPTQAAPDSQSSGQGDTVVVLNKVPNSDGTTTVTVRIYAAPNDPSAPDTTFGLSQDTYIASSNPNGNYGSATNMGIGFNSAGLGAMRLLLQFNLSSIPSTATINSATVFIFQNAVSPSNDAPMGFLAQYAVAPWNEFNATWNNANFLGGSSLPVGNFPNTLGWLSIGATNLFRNWVSGVEPNNGLILTGDESPSNNRSRFFASSNAGSNRPYVDINYTTGCTYPSPTSSVNPLPATSPNAFMVTWTGTAFTPTGCPANRIASYIVWYQVNNGGFTRWLDGVTGTSAQFNASSFGIGNGSIIGFRSQATDIFGNRTPAGNATAQTTISISPPTVNMTSLPAWTNSSTIAVNWTGNTQGGPAITSYNFQVSTNGGSTWQTLLTNTPQTTFQYTGAQTNVNYIFRAQASNDGGNSFGPWAGPSGTTVDLVAPVTSMNPLPTFSTSSSFWVSWSATDATSGVATYNLQAQINGGAWQTLISNTPQTSFFYQNGQTGQVLGFRVQAVDNADNVSAWPDNAQTSTTVFANPIAIVQPFNPAILQATASVTNSFPVSWVGYTPGGTFITSYTVLFRYNGGPWTLWANFPSTQTTANFDWANKPGLADGIYDFQATAANSAGQPPLQLPQYAKTMIVDMAGAYQVGALLPILVNNTP